MLPLFKTAYVLLLPLKYFKHLSYKVTFLGNQSYNVFS